MPEAYCTQNRVKHANTHLPSHTLSRTCVYSVRHMFAWYMSCSGRLMVLSRGAHSQAILRVTALLASPLHLFYSCYVLYNKRIQTDTFEEALAGDCYSHFVLVDGEPATF
jgi:hypothetical protein